MYRGRLAPSPTGLLHRGHAHTFWVAQQRATLAGGTLILRSDDLDQDRVRPEFVAAMLEDLRWLGLTWAEGPDVGGPFAPYAQSLRLDSYRAAFHYLREQGLVFPCTCSRRDVQSAVNAPHAIDDEPIYPGTCRQRSKAGDAANWRFRVPDGSECRYIDGALGLQTCRAGSQFGDFVVWRRDGLPSYQLACVVDDARMGITEVVRGADLVTSTYRQLLLYEALGYRPPSFYHCPLILDENGRRLSKRDRSTTLRGLRQSGWTPEDFRSTGRI